MPYATVDDDGERVTVDLHGTSVEEAIHITDRILEEAARRGRDRVKIVHGSSTSDPYGSNRTIKHELHDRLDRGAFATAIASDLRADNYILLSLPVASHSDRTPISILDIMH